MKDAFAIKTGLFCASIHILTAGQAVADTIQVPFDQPTIQAAIDAAADGDVVSVAPGTYVENINFLGKAITVVGEQGPEETVIDGGGSGSVVTFTSGEGRDAVLSGFTVQNGSGNFAIAGGIQIGNNLPLIVNSPTIAGNRITANRGCQGIGIRVSFGSPLIQGNVISANTTSACTGGSPSGGGLRIGGEAAAEILDNVISNNVIFGGDGGGIYLFAAGSPIIKGNVISGNSTSSTLPTTSGGGIAMFNRSDAVITQNLIINNRSDEGGGVFWLVPSGGRGPTVVNNTIADNDASQGEGSAVFADGFDANALLVNNVIAAPAGQTALTCGGLRDPNPPIIEFNNVVGESGPAYGGICSDQTGLNGNISADPLFVDADGGDYSVAEGSPVIDAGDNLAPELPATDFLGKERIVDGDGDGVADIDMGAFEFQSTPTPVDPTERLRSLILTVKATDIQQPLKLRLKVKLKVALWSLNGSNPRKEIIAVRLLESFIAHVEANRGTKIQPADADLLVTEAEAIIDALLNPPAA